MEMSGYQLQVAHANARRALMGVYRSTGVETASMVTESDLMKIIRNGIADAFQDEDGCPQAGQAPAQALDCSSLSDVPSDKRNSNAERQTEVAS
jgi:hypothetical protein